MRVESVMVDGIPAEWICPPDIDAERAVLYLRIAQVGFGRAAQSCAAESVD